MNKCKWKDGSLVACKESLKDGFYEYVEEGMYNYCPFCGASLKKPVKIKVGMFGKFENDESYAWDILTDINDCGTFDDNNYGAWDSFAPGLPEGFNQDGTPKDKHQETSCTGCKHDFEDGEFVVDLAVAKCLGCVDYDKYEE